MRALLCFLLAMFVGSGAFAFELDEAIKADRDLVKRIQQQLGELGYSPGSADGSFGNKLRAAIETFAADQAIEPGLTAPVVERISLAHASWFEAPKYIGQTIFTQPRLLFEVDLTELDPDCDIPQCTVNFFFLAASDLTGDGAPDLVFSTIQMDSRYRDLNKPSPTVILVNDGKGNFSYLHEGDPGKTPRRVHGREAAVGDFNGDGVNDLFVAAQGLDRNPFPGEPALLMLSEGGTLKDVSKSNLEPLSAMNHGVVAEDVDLDGDLDLFVITNFGSKTVDPYFLINDGTGKFRRSNEPERLTESLRVFLKGRLDRSKSTTARFVDLNKDGAKELIFAISGDDADRANRYSGLRRTRIVTNDGQNRWLREAAVELPVRRWGYATYTTGLDAGDVDGDGDIDLVLPEATQINGAWRGQHHQLMLNDGKGGFTDATATHLWRQGYAEQKKMTFPYETFLEDLDNDGDLDMVTQTLDPLWDENTGQAGKRAVVALNDGSGKFQPIEPVGLSSRSHTGRQLRPVDIDGDGDVDLVGAMLTGMMRNGEYYTGGFQVQLLRNRTID
jgi:hypothetical protein